MEAGPLLRQKAKEPRSTVRTHIKPRTAFNNQQVDSISHKQPDSRFAQCLKSNNIND